MELSEQEREELMACEFVVKGIWEDSPYTTPGRLIDIDYAIGITIVSKEDPTDYLYCILGPTVSKNDGVNPPDGLYDTLFQEVIQDIKNGIVDITNTKRSDSYTPFADFCAFNR